jgi:DNA-binding response OmpR family regulator
MNLSTASRDELVGRITALTETIDGIRSAMSGAGSLPAEWKLTPKERDLFLALIRHEIVTKKMATVLLYGADDRQSHSIDVFLSRIRKKTADYKVTIETINRTGYRLVDRLVWAKKLKLDIPAEH